MLRVALTGNVAGGKSTVAAIWREAGVPVVEADALAREVVAPGSEGLEEVVRLFGPGVLRGDGSLDRDRVRELVFRNPDLRRRLEEVLHPRIRARRDELLAEARRRGEPLVVAEIPLLFETGSEGEYDVVVVVDAPEEVRLRRLVEGRGLRPGEARRVMAAQMDPREKRARADIVLENDGTPEELRERTLEVLEELRRRAGAGDPAVGSPGGERLRVDLHLHTRASRDCLTDPEELLERARELGLARVAVTDHDTLEAARELARRHPDTVIPGEEVRTAEGFDVIGLYLEEEIPRGTPAVETCRRIREQGGLVYLPHPFARGKGGSGRRLALVEEWVDVVEVFNARLHPARLNRRAAEWAERRALLRGAGSDAHSLGEVGRAHVECPAHPNRPGALREALASARVRGRTSPWAVHLHSTWARVRKSRLFP